MQRLINSTGAVSRSAAGLENSGAVTGSSGLAAGSALANGKEQEVPKAYLNYLLYDENYQLVDQGFQQVSQAAAVGKANPSATPEALTLEVPVAEEGFLYTYLSNEPGAGSSNSLVYFDDFTVEQQSYIVAVHDLYPFGLSFEQPVNQPLSNRFIFSGKERQTDLGLNWDDFGARMYDPALGRFHTIDRFAEKYTALSPYQYAANNPIRYIDVNGDSIWVSYGQDQRVLYDNGAFFNENGSEYDGDNKFISAVGTRLSEMNGTENGQKLLGILSGSENNFTFTNATSSGGERSLSFSPSKDGGGTIQAAALLNLDIQAGQRLESTAHELFHGFQHEID